MGGTSPDARSRRGGAWGGRVWRIVAVALVLACALSSARADPAARAREVLADRAYQTALPVDGQAAPPFDDFGDGDTRGSSRGDRGDGDGADRDGTSGDRSGDGGSSSYDGEGFASDAGGGGSGVVAQAVLWGLAALLMAWIAVWALRYRKESMLLPSAAPARPSAPDLGATSVAPQPRPAASEVELAVADARYGDAIHLLLLDALVTLRERVEEVRDASRTSREVLGARGLPDGTRAPLERLVALVEAERFAGRTAGEHDYTAARASLDELNGTLGARPAGAPR